MLVFALKFFLAPCKKTNGLETSQQHSDPYIQDDKTTYNAYKKTKHLALPGGARTMDISG